MGRINAIKIFNDDKLLHKYCEMLIRTVMSDFMLCGFINYGVTIKDIENEDKLTKARVYYTPASGYANIVVYKSANDDLRHLSKNIIHECFHINQYEYFELDEDIDNLIKDSNIKKHLLNRSLNAMEHLCSRVINFLDWKTDYIDNTIKLVIKEMQDA